MFEEGTFTKGVRDFEDLYGVTKDGRIYSYRRNQVISPYQNGNRLIVTFYRDGKATRRAVHSVVAEAYLENYNPHKKIKHIDSDFTNNDINNLTQIQDKPKRPLGAPKKPVRCIQTGTVYASLTEAAEAMEVSPINISKAARGITHSSNGYTWEFVEGDKNGTEAETT